MRSVFAENGDAKEKNASKSIAFGKACDRDLKRAALGLPFPEKKSLLLAIQLYM